MKLKLKEILSTKGIAMAPSGWASVARFSVVMAAHAIQRAKWASRMSWFMDSVQKFCMVPSGCGIGL